MDSRFLRSSTATPMNNRSKTNADQFDAAGHRASLPFDRASSAARIREAAARSFEIQSDPLLKHHLIHVPKRKSAEKPLRVMKFGGTSVGDAASIRRVVEIVRQASRTDYVVVVVSAMSGVTSKLVEVANRAGAGDLKQALALVLKLKQRHETAAQALIASLSAKNALTKTIRAILQEIEEICREVAECQILTPEEADAIAGEGERLSVYLVAAALQESGAPCEAIEATELVVTDEHHGAAEPRMDLTRERCQARLRAMVREGVIPVITGFIGATEEGKLTTLGRNSSDYSATILSAAVDADLVEIWTDVDGVLTADPKVVAEARLIPEISFREAAEMASCGAKVLHTKCLRPLIISGIPLRICNTFAPDGPGTKIVPSLALHGGHAKAIAAAGDFSMVMLRGIDEAIVQNFWGRVESAANAAAVEIRLACQSDSKDDVGFVVASSGAGRLMDVFDQEFGADLSPSYGDAVSLDADVAVVTAVGHNICGNSEFLARVFDALTRANIRVLGVRRDYSETSFSFVVVGKHMKAALVAAHGEFQSEPAGLQSPALKAV
jgi:aspartokinase/homoserine dehydrogenase 1